MTKTYISDLQEGNTIEGVFLCGFKALLTDKNGKPYLNLRLVDRTGTVESRIWDKAPLMTKKFEKQDYVWVKGNVVRFLDHLQLNVVDIQQVPAEKVDPDDFLPHTKQDIEQMYQQLLQICRQDLNNPFIQKLLLSILEDPQMAPGFKRAPAAKGNHHAWIGGLLEHVLKLCQVGLDVLKHYPQVDSDLVLAGLILHDFGKIEELESERYFEYTDKGRLVGHLIISVEIILKKSAQIPDFPPKILHHLQHILLAHHGRLEYGSPKEPMTLEALMVHHLDNMDSKLQGFLDVVEKDAGADQQWTGTNFMFGRPLYKSTRQDLEKSVNPPADSVPPRTTSPKKKPHSKPKRPKGPPPSAAPLKTNLGELLNQQLKKSN